LPDAKEMTVEPDPVEAAARYEVHEYEVWDDWLMRVLFWLAAIGFGWLIGWTLGS
jgi:hypothetical protein